MEEEFSEPAGVSLAGDFDLKENSLLLRKQNRNTATTSDPGYVVRKVDNAIHLAPVVRRLDNAIHRRNRHPLENKPRYLLDRD